MSKRLRVLVTGAGGFIGHHLVRRLVDSGCFVRGVDVKRPEFESSPAHEFVLRDLRHSENCEHAVADMHWVFHLAANMGGIGFIEAHKAEIVRDNTLIDLHMLEAARHAHIERFLYASTACVYPLYKQQREAVEPLRESDAYPADPEDGYGWEKLYIERACRHYREDYGVSTYVARFHNIFGPLGTYEGGREKSPAALCRKIALVEEGGEIEIWGDGEQTRSYCYVDDCVEGLWRLIHTDHHQPLNVGQDRLVSVNELADIIARLAKKRIRKRHDLTKPQGVRGRNSDNTEAQRVLGWTPEVSLEAGLAKTYQWIAGRVQKQHARNLTPA